MPAAGDKDKPVAKEAKPVAKKDLKKKGSYLLGVNLVMRTQINRQFFSDDIDLDSLIKGIKDTMSGDLVMKPEEFQKTFQAFFESLQAQHTVDFEKNKKVGTEFLAANKKKKGVIELPSGVQYQVIKSGKDDAKRPTLLDEVTCHYHGTLIDGTVFDSSVKRDEPAKFSTRGVIRGWTDALQLMKIGDKWKLFIPQDQAYGKKGSPPKIGPGSTLVFELELLDVKPMPKRPAMPGRMPGGMPPRGR